MIQLGANQEILSKFRVLLKEDVKSSTALLDPNNPGSSTLQLSWIWQAESNMQQGSTRALQECVCFSLNLVNVMVLHTLPY
jgi:hypothetical protein